MYCQVMLLKRKAPDRRNNHENRGSDPDVRHGAHRLEVHGYVNVLVFHTGQRQRPENANRPDTCDYWGTLST